MENYLDLQASFKFNISMNFPRNHIGFKPDGFLIINGFKIKIFKKFAIYCSKKILNIYSNEKIKNNNENILKISIEKDQQLLDWFMTKENLNILQSFFCMKTIVFTKSNFELLKFISNELEIPFLSNALNIYESFLEDNVELNSKSVKILKDDENLQNLLETYSHENDATNLKKQIEKIIELQLDNHYFYQSITLFCISNPMKIEKFVNIITDMNKTDEFLIYLNSILKAIPGFYNEKEYLLSLIQPKKISNDNPNQKDKTFLNFILQLIRDDNINEFQRITSTIATFDLNSKFILNDQSIFESRITLFSNINEFFKENSPSNNKLNYLDFAAFYGSVKIFKYLLLMKVEMNEFVALFAVSGGNTEIIHLCEQNKCNFKNALKFAIIYRHFELIDWLVDTINVDNFESFINDMIYFHRNDLILKYINLENNEKTIQQLIMKSIVYDNYQLFLFLNELEMIDLKLKFDKNKSGVFSLFSNYNNSKFYEFLFNVAGPELILEDRDIYGQTPVHIAAMKGNLKLLKFLASKNINFELHAYDDLTPLHFACMYGQYEIVKFIVSLPNINVNCLDRCKQTPLVKACLSNNQNTLQIVDLLLNNVFVNCNYVDINNKTILLNTIQNGMNEASIMLINYNRNIDINKGNMFYNPLCLACKLNKTEIVKCLLNHNDLKVNEKVNNGVNHLLIGQPYILLFQVLFKL